MIINGWVRKGKIEDFENEQANAYNYLHLDVTAFPLQTDDVEIIIKRVI